MASASVASALAVIALLAGGAPAPERTVYLFELRGVPVGSVTLGWTPGPGGTGSYEYRSTHLFRRGEDRRAQVRSARYAVDAEGRGAEGRRPASLALWRKPAPGCVAVRDELTAREGPLCAEEGGAKGTLLGTPYEAEYGGDRLRQLRLGDARFTVVEAGWGGMPVAVPDEAPVDLFADGVPVRGGGAGVLALRGAKAREEPPAPAGIATWTEAAARAESARVHASFPEKRPGAADLRAPRDDDEAGSCLAHARRFQAAARAAGKGAEVVLGLVTDGPTEARAWPHAWVRVRLEGGRWLELDPTSRVEVQPETHLALRAVASLDGSEGQAEAGALWLGLLAGQLQVERVPRRGAPER